MKQTNMISKTQLATRAAIRVSIITIVVNLILSVFKLFAGIFGRSGAMISDAVHSASDVFSTFIVMLGIHLSSKKADRQHPYGHERFECVAALILAILLFLTGIGIGLKGIENIILKNHSYLQAPTLFALLAAVVSTVVKEWMYWYTRAVAKKINSGSLMADAWHHRSDALSSIGAFIGILGAKMGLSVLDPLAGVIICLLICKASFDIFKDALDKMIDKACDCETEDKLKKVILGQNGVLDIDKMNTRLFGARIYVDVEISADGSKTLNETHTIARRVHDVIEQKFFKVKHCMVHVNPHQDNTNLFE